MITYVLVAAVSGITAAGGVAVGNWLISGDKNSPSSSVLDSRIGEQGARIERVIQAFEVRISPIEDKINLINGRLGAVEEGSSATVTRDEVVAAFQAAADAEERRRLAAIEAEQAEERRREDLLRQEEEEQQQLAAIEQWKAQQRDLIRQELLAEQRRPGAALLAQLAQQQAETPGVQVRFARPELGIPEPLDQEGPWEEGQA